MLYGFRWGGRGRLFVCFRRVVIRRLLGSPPPIQPPLSEVLRIVALIEQFHTFILLYDTEYDEYTIHTYMSVDLLVR